MLSPHSRDNDEIVQVATMDTISLKDKEIEPQRALPSGYHGHHERSRDEFGLQMDSTEALLGSPIALGNTHNSMKRGSLKVVARDGIEPPTPAFSGLRSTN
jgi:hypothetical protein